jgi:hypothetical protein
LRQKKQRQQDKTPGKMRSKRHQFWKSPTASCLKSCYRRILNKREPVTVTTNRHELRRADLKSI